MLRKSIIKGILFTALFFLVVMTERVLGTTALSVGLLFALIFCREKFYVALPCFIAANLALNFSIPTLILVGASTLFVLLACFLKAKKIKYTVALSGIFTAVSQIPAAALSPFDAYSIVMSAVSILASVVFHFISITVMYPILVRGMRFRFTFNEQAAVCVMVCVASIGLFAVNIFGVSPFYLIVVFALLTARFLDIGIIYLLAACAGLGASIASNDPTAVLLCTALALACAAFSKTNVCITALASALAFTCAVYFFNGEMTLKFMLPPLIGAVFACLVPRKLIAAAAAYRESGKERFALRATVNRDRADVAKRLKGVASAFSQMQEILIEEKASEDDPSSIVRSVASVCGNCARKVKCAERLGDPYPHFEKLTAAALENGKCTILDAPVAFGESCNRLAQVINLVNESVKQFRRAAERKSGIEQGKEMVISQISGVSRLLSSLAQSVGSNLTFDTDTEKRLIDDLLCANVIATDAAVYLGAESEATVVVREADADKEAIAPTVSQAVGVDMTEASRQAEVKGMVSLYFTASPRYGIVFGESVVSKENRSGDTRQAVKIGQNRLMFILSDGMGTGADAFVTSSHTVSLIETFYKAGFDHKTTFACVAKLLALRKKEDFSALDVVVVDTQNGFADFIKQGGRESYIMSASGEFSVIYAETLPLGIIEEAEPAVERRRLANGDILVMVSDGIADVMTPDDVRALLSNTAHNPQLLADSICANALRLAGEGKDDMTALVMRFLEK